MLIILGNRGSVERSNGGLAPAKDLLPGSGCEATIVGQRQTRETEMSAFGDLFVAGSLDSIYARTNVYCLLSLLPLLPRYIIRFFGDLFVGGC